LKLNIRQEDKRNSKIRKEKQKSGEFGGKEEVKGGYLISSSYSGK